MPTIFRAAILAALFGLSALLVVQGGRGVDQKRDEVFETLVIVTAGGPRSFLIEVARSSSEKSRGLMFRTKLKPGFGMLFPYETPKPVSMWMRNTYISLDMIFVTADGRIHRIEERAQPHSDKIINSQGVVSGVLEIGGGEAARLKIRVGDMVLYSHFGTAEAER